MNTRHGLIALAIATAAFACAKAADEPSAADVAQAVVADSAQRAAVVEQLVAKHLAAMEAGNAELLDSLSGPDLVHINSAGEKLTRADLLTRAKAGNAVGFEVVDVRTRVFGDVVVVNAQIKEKASGRLHELTQVWVARRDKKVAAADAVGRSPVQKVSRQVILAQAAAVSTGQFMGQYACVSSHSSISAGEDASESAMNKPNAVPDISAGRSGQ